VDASGQVAFQVVVGADATILTLAGGRLARPGWSHLAATYTASMAQANGTPRLDAGGQPTFDCSAQLYVDGVSVGSVVRTLPRTGALNPPAARLLMGAAGPAGPARTPAAYTGRLDSVRVWNRALAADQIAAIHADPGATGSQQGLIAFWPFDEGSGVVARDVAGTNDASLGAGTVWEFSSLSAGWQVYLNGLSLPGVLARTSTMLAAARQLTLGGSLRPVAPDARGADTPARPFSGHLDEVRIWNAARTQQQINDVLYRPLTGTEDGLLAYWPIDGASDVDSVVHDRTGHHWDATKRSVQVVPSDAPLGEEGPEVANALASMPRSGARASGALAAVEYGDLETNASQAVGGVMKRSYAFVDNGALHLATGFAVGDLDVQFIGQVQTEPTLVGYIEGAPPVPSENLTVSDAAYHEDYDGTSSVALTEMDNSLVAFSANRNQFSDISTDLKVGAFVASETSGGGLISTLIFKSDTRITAHLKFDTSLGWLQDSSISSGTLQTLTNTLQLKGHWEDRNSPAYPELGPRWLPDNRGYALVKSRTADLYALQLKSARTTVSYQILPDPNIPEDWNIISFPIDPRYVKNGSLDGTVGLHPASDPQARSYFKPEEAYQLKTQIEREEAALRSFYDQYEVGRGRYNVDPASVLPSSDRFDAGRRSLVNTYVWTADGGLYAEEEQTASVQEQSEGGSYYLLFQYGAYLDLRMGSTGWGVGVEADLLFGGHVDVAVSKSQQSSRSFGLSVHLEGESDLLDAEGRPIGGKVDAYRFMTFYLAPASDHSAFFFSNVVDQDWLSTATDPNAIALRMARGKPNKVWRVLHRVTYVHRIPAAGDEAPQTLAPAALPARADGTGNRALIELIDASLSGAPATLAVVANALDGILMEHPDLIGASWSAFAASARSGGAERVLLDRIRQNSLKYLSNYYGIV
jgi:Concanavalin A-like lectin/glucanases superfamily